MFEQAIEALAKRAAEANPPAEGDYIKDGLLFCGKCHTQKQCFVNNPFEEGKIDVRSCICKCKQAEMQAAEDARKRVELERRVKELRRVGFPDEDMQNWTFDRDDGMNKKVGEVMRRYVEKFPEMRRSGKGLLLHGPVGTGKTFAAACVANALVDRGFPCLMTNFARLINTLSGMYDGKQAYIDGLNRFDLLVIDDLATEANTEYRNEIVFNVIDSRCRAGLPLIITTNLTGDQLKHPADTMKQRIYSRLFEMCIPFEIAGQDRRRKKLTEDYKGFADILGL